MLERERIGDNTSHALFAEPLHFSRSVESMMRTGRILKDNQSPTELFNAAVKAIFSVESTSFHTSQRMIDSLEEEMSQYITDGNIMLSSPSLTNINSQRALSSCAVMPINLRDKQNATRIFKDFALQNMGGGFNLKNSEKPLEDLLWVESISSEESATGNYERYVGNLVQLPADHKDIDSFIPAKRKENYSHVNISVGIDDFFMWQYENGSTYTRSIMHLIAENALYNGDPGVIFTSTLENDNPLKLWGRKLPEKRYESSPPCAEMGLREGQVCNFIYLNLHSFVKEQDIDWEKLEDVVTLATRAADNMVEYGMPYYPSLITKTVSQEDRKIALAPMGLADMLISLGLAYDSAEGREKARDVTSFINYHAKSASVNLAAERGICGTMESLDNEYYRPYPAQRFLYKYEQGAQGKNYKITSDMWRELSEEIFQTSNLRNMTHTAAPPSGRSSIMSGVTPSLEPIITPFTYEGEIKPAIVNYISRMIPDKAMADSVLARLFSLRSIQAIEGLPAEVYEVLKKSIEINPLDKIKMIGGISGKYGTLDESASVTIHLSQAATVEDVENYINFAYDQGMKSISFYRDKSKEGQPLEL